MEKILSEEIPSYINVHVGSRGRYYWDIKINLKPVKYVVTPSEDLTSPNAATKIEPLSGADEVVTQIKEIDRRLREAFPNNAAELKNTSKFGKFTDEEGSW